ncbi:pentatricopeptide repeat-containing protein At5g39710-like [Lotus japonicus]|uniref:pentatricopeptide repeat-containing protein At5g39710-like n=1 Tax=Lotus japonicus TaxID=34305 RepID=UPI002588A3ED|nr:pentatricopeptide repeat-containing protein At5g39710-like [Lotus japonicus]
MECVEEWKLNTNKVTMMLRVKTILRNRLLPLKVIIPGFAAAGNLQPESNKVSGLWNLKARTEKDVGRIREVAEKTNQKGLVSFNATATIQDLCGKGRMEEAEEVFEEMNRKGLALDQRTYTSLIHMFCHQEEVDKAYKVLSEMIDRGFSPSVATYNKLVRAYCEEDRVREAAGILRVMADRGLSPDVDIYNTVITWGGDQELELDTALEFKAKMVEKGILPHADTYSWLIVSLCFERRLSEAFDLFREMLRGGLSTGFHRLLLHTTRLFMGIVVWGGLRRL